MREAGANLVPPVFQTINETITRHARYHVVEKQLIGCRKQDPDRRNLRERVKIVISGLGRYPAFAATCEWPDLHRRFRINRDPQRVGCCIGCPIDLG
jgi:hypothetical protein